MKPADCNAEGAGGSALCPAPLFSRSAKETQQIGERLGEMAQPGDVLCLFGDLGAGKTTLTQGVARGLGIARRITSPTFTLVQEYEGRLRLVHLDCYRLAGPDDLEPLGADDWMAGDGLVVIEWPERVLAALPPDRLDLQIQADGDGRTLALVPRGARAAEWARQAAGLLSSSGGSP